MNELRTAQDFHDFFAAIPVWKWTTRTFENRFGQRCAIGHLKAEFGGYGLNETVLNFERVIKSLGSQPADINDAGKVFGFDGKYWAQTKIYKQWTAKGRVLAALKDAMVRGM